VGDTVMKYRRSFCAFMLWLPLDLGAGDDYAIGWFSNPRRSKRLRLLRNRPDWLWYPRSLVFHGWGEG